MCITCQIEAKRQAGVEVTNAERNHWMLWGCTCDPEAAQAAAAYLQLVTV
jgi:hypothetical protein